MDGLLAPAVLARLRETYQPRARDIVGHVLSAAHITEERLMGEDDRGLVRLGEALSRLAEGARKAGYGMAEYQDALRLLLAEQERRAAERASGEHDHPAVEPAEALS